MFKNSRKRNKKNFIKTDGEIEKIYEKNFKNDLYENDGKLIYPNGDIYEGDFKNGKVEGRGK
jgi:hypothetical protein